MSRRAKDKICGDGAIVSVHIRDNKGDNPIEVIAKQLLLGFPTQTLGASIQRKSAPRDLWLQSVLTDGLPSGRKQNALYDRRGGSRTFGETHYQ
jgi:hypothetical protein